MKKWKICMGIIFIGCVFGIFLLWNQWGAFQPSDEELLQKDSSVTTEVTGTFESEKGLMETKSDEIMEITTEDAIENITKNAKEVPSFDKLLKTAILPVGNTMYIWGGGWNEADDGPGIEAVTIGVSPRWGEYAKEQDASYNHHCTSYQIHDGLDCSGYIGWLMYNVMNTEDGKAGYVMYAHEMAQTFASYGWGEYRTSGDYKPGDICSMSGHVWMCLGTCSDGSVLLIHSSPPGVRICGTKLPGGGKSEAVVLATDIMREHFKDWYERYPDCEVSDSYLTASVRMRWDTSILSDENHIQDMSGEQVAEYLFD